MKKKVKVKAAFFIEKTARPYINCMGMEEGALPLEVTAILTDFEFGGDGRYFAGYSHEGQHNTCQLDWIAEENRPASESEYAELLSELKNRVGYDIKVVDAEKWLTSVKMSKVSNRCAA